jgi:hypothetical protein
VGTAKAVIDKLNRELVTGLKSKHMQVRLAADKILRAVRQHT